MFSSIASQPLPTPLRQMEPVSKQGLSLQSALNNQDLMVSDKNLMPSQQAGEMGPTPLLPTKRKPATEPFLVPNKRVAHMEAHVNSPRSLPQSALNKKHMQLQETSNKRMIRNESMSSSRIVLPRVQTSKSKAGPPEVSPKAKNESYEAVRMKMRETLASALSVGNNNQDKENVSNEGKSAPKEAGSTAGDAAPDTSIQNLERTDGQNPQYNYVMPDTDGSFSDTFFAKDELLQGNGLSWAWDLEEAQTNEKSNASGNGIEQLISSPQELAVRIESELFKLFGGVNKKYKEKGRSLMFNLKDPNNPDLREKVLSAKISPERLCSMTPEELASKELSEWRMAKAEELDKMIVLPDSDVDMRRLVKKTHKGEYQVEVEQDDNDGVSVEVSVGSTSITRFREKTKTPQPSSSANESNEVKEKVVTTGSLTVNTDGNDIMQDLIVDEFKDEGFLPPIVSLDEFMESLDSEPPFENLPVDEGNEKANRVDVEASFNNHNKPNVKTLEDLSSVKSTSETSVERKFLSPVNESIDESLWEGELQLTLSSSVPVIGLFRSGEKTSTKEWRGSIEIKGRVRLEAFEKFLQELPMSRSRAVMVVHFVMKDASSDHQRASLTEVVDSYVAEERVGFGEPVPGVELYFCPPHQRTRETLNRLLSKDWPGVPVILNPPDNNGLIGVVVWRRPNPSSTILPNSSTHHKHHRKHLSSKRQENINANKNSNITSKSNIGGDNDVDDDDDDDDIPPGFGPGVVARDEDDLPEFSFSKGSNSSGQTLPTQSGSGSGSRMTATQPVAHMRQLVYEYGQMGNNNNNNNNNNTTNGFGSTIRRQWNQNDNDDIPEWNPQLQNNRIQELSRVHLVNQVRPGVGQIVNPVMPIRQPVNLMQNSWVQPPVPHGLLPNAALPGQQPYAGQWRQEDPRGRGF